MRIQLSDLALHLFICGLKARLVRLAAECDYRFTDPHLVAVSRRLDRYIAEDLRRRMTA